MPAIMTIGGIALAVLGLLITFAGMPDWAAGLGLGSDLIQAGVTVMVGGLIVAALGLVLRALRDVADRVEEAGFGLSGPRASVNDGLGQETPIPLPRAGMRDSVSAQEEEFAEPVQAPAARSVRPSREAQAPQQQPISRTPRAAEASRQPSQVRQDPRLAPREEPNFDAQQDEQFADEASAEHQEPRWMRAQTETNNRQQSAGVIPLQSTRQSRATPVAQPPRREPQQQPAASYEPVQPRRRAAAEPVEEEFAEASVVRSGIISGMAYTLYSDGSIEAELPAGTVRFGSLAELQEHVKRAGAEGDDTDYRGPTAAQN